MNDEQTPGPWTSEKYSPASILKNEYVISPPHGEIGPVALVSGEANARLIAAATDMFLICELLPDAEDDAQLLRELIKKAHAIVAGIEGEQDG